MTTQKQSLLCPASMCPLIAKDGSPWDGSYKAPCPGHDDIDTGGCPWWSMACSTGGIQGLVDEADTADGNMLVIGPNKPKRLRSNSRKYDCQHAESCRWQEQSELKGLHLCPPRDALSRGLDPRVCLF